MSPGPIIFMLVLVVFVLWLCIRYSVDISDIDIDFD